MPGYITKLRVPAGPDTLFAPGCFDAQRDRGEPIRLTIGDDVALEAKLLRYEIVDNGRAALLELRMSVPS